MAILSGQTYYSFYPNGISNGTEDIVTDRQDISAGLFSGGTGTLSAVFTSSVQTASSGQYYVDVYNVATSSTTTTPEVQFSVAYGHKFGSGSLILNQQYPTRAIFSQYKNVLLDPTDEYFTFGTTSKSHIIALNFKMDRIKQTLDPGNWQLGVLGTNSKVTTLIDDSGQTLSAASGKSGRVFNIVSGTIAGGVYTPSTPVNYGLVYPDLGYMIFDPDSLATNALVPCNVSSSNINSSNHVVFLRGVSGSMSNFGSNFIARNSENIPSTHYFVRVKNQAFNFSNNPTFITGSLGDLYNVDMVKNPSVYLTTIGLYNDNNELLAIAKVSQPIKKTFTNELLVRVKLDY